MLVTMTNDCVTVYSFEEKQYLELLKNTNDKKKINDSAILSILKDEYSPIKLYNQLGSSLARLDFYYYDNGTTMIRKSINDILDIKYYEDENGKRWPSYEYLEFVQTRAVIPEKQATLIELDNKLNKCSHINTIFTSDELIDFKRCYDQTPETKALSMDIRGKFYEVPSFSRLILRKNNKKLTSAQLENNIFIIVTPSGLTERGKVKYLISEYKLTKKDCDEINKIFRKYLKENNVKVDSLSEKDKYEYFDRAVAEHVQNVRGGLEQLNGGTSISFGGKAQTWNEYKALFFSTHGYPIENFSSNWLIFSKMILDARTVNNGNIVPLIIENYQYSISNNYDKTLSEETIDTLPFDNEPELSDDDEDDLLANPEYIILPKNKY